MQTHEIWFSISTLLLSYAIGSIPTAYIVTKKLKGVDIREHGSKNPGATNVMRVVNKKAGWFVLIFDFCKGLVPVLIVKWLMPQYPLLHTLIALAAVLGHSKSMWLQFTGGKSAITALGVIGALRWEAAALLALLAWAVIKITRTVSIGSITAAICAPIIFWLLKSPTEYVVSMIFCCLYVVYLHRANIQRIRAGTENKIGESKIVENKPGESEPGESKIGESEEKKIG